MLQKNKKLAKYLSFVASLYVTSTYVSATPATPAATPAPAAGSGIAGNETVRNAVKSFFGFKESADDPQPTPTAAPVAAPAATSAPTTASPATTPAPTTQAVATSAVPTNSAKDKPSSDPDFSSITDPLIKSCAVEFNGSLKKCSGTNVDSCNYDAQNKFKGCIRPVIARRVLKQFASLFDDAETYFRAQPLFKSCSDKFSEYIAQCQGHSGCKEVLYYSLHNDCGKRLYNSGFIAGKSAKLETNLLSNNTSSTDGATDIDVSKPAQQSTQQPAQQTTQKPAPKPAQQQEAAPPSDDEGNA